MNSKTQINWKQILKIVITVLTALAGALGVASCTA
ncbi:MAG: smalltalk protein [Bacteroidaceae bacterium]|nr:smalltalk protein [Bacteroidaceae bacterium]